MAEPGTRRVTSADVARLAGVSRATVSYVLNDTPRQTISAGTRGRVIEAATTLGYAPSAAARTLRTGRSDVVLGLLPDWPIGAEVGTMLANLSTELARTGLTFVVHPGNREDRPISEIWKAITPAAVIAFADFSPGEMAAMRSAGVAFVVALFGREPQHGRELEVPQQLVGRRQVEHLTAAGHTRLGYARPDDERLRIFAEPRLDGVRAASPYGRPFRTPVAVEQGHGRVRVQRRGSTGRSGRRTPGGPDRSGRPGRDRGRRHPAGAAGRAPADDGGHRPVRGRRAPVRDRARGDERRARPGLPGG
jgi:DNA-binding LacI/PurR family transcriptional regulator